MNPDKLFDYLDGKLSPADRVELENKLIDDPHLQQQFAIAREIHRSGRTSREINVPVEDPAVAEGGSRLGRRIATAAIALVLFNVFAGLGAITYLNKRPAKRMDAPRSEDSAAVRRQMENSLRQAGASVLPVPSLSDEQISLAAPKAEWTNFAAAIVQAAEACDGSAVTAQPSAESITVTAHLPQERFAEFRQRLLGAGSTAPTQSSESMSDAAFKTVQIRIAEAAR